MPSPTNCRRCVNGSLSVRVSGDVWHSYAPIVEAASHEIEPIVTRADEPAIMYFTSGTTGHPKMVLHTQASYGIGHTTTGRYWLDLGPDDLHWNVSDTGWAKAAWSSLFGPWIQGAGLFVQHSPGRFQPGDVFEDAQQVSDHDHVFGSHDLPSARAGRPLDNSSPKHYDTASLRVSHSTRRSSPRGRKRPVSRSLTDTDRRRPSCSAVTSQVST